MKEERCPYCHSDEYDTVDFDQDYFDENEVSFFWSCECSRCKNTFYITKWYKLIDTSVQTQEEWNDR